MQNNEIIAVYIFFSLNLVKLIVDKFWCELNLLFLVEVDIEFLLYLHTFS